MHVLGVIEWAVHGKKPSGEATVKLDHHCQFHERPV
jgi:hypothetical protein